MRHLWFSLIAIGVAAVAAMTATTALLNTPVRHAPAVITQNMAPDSPASAPASKPATTEQDPEPAAPAKSGGATPDTAAKPGAGADKKPGADADDEGDKDPYEGIAPEELPPDLQYSADSSVSFPTNI
jgi:hypothetical protein